MVRNQEARGIWTYGLWLPYTLILISGRLVVELLDVLVHVLRMILLATTRWMESVQTLLVLVSGKMQDVSLSLTRYINILLASPKSRS